MNEAEDVSPRVPTRLAEWSLSVIKALLEANCVEDGRFDWKEMLPQDPSGRDRLVRAAAAMANAGGGFIIFGVRDDGPMSERMIGVAADKEFGRELSQQLQRADPPVPHMVQNPPLAVGGGRCIYVVEIVSNAAPHADVERQYYVRTGGGTAQRLSTHQLRGLLRSYDVQEAPGLNEIAKIAFTFLRPSGGWERLNSGLHDLTHYAVEGTPKQKLAVLEALTRLASHTRSKMPSDMIIEMLSVAEEATPHAPGEAPSLFRESFELAARVAGHVGYDCALYVRYGFGVHTSARLLSSLLARAEKLGFEDLRSKVIEQFDLCLSGARRSQPEPFTDAVRWYEYQRANPCRWQQVPPVELDAVEARLLGAR